MGLHGACPVIKGQNDCGEVDTGCKIRRDVYRAVTMQRYKGARNNTGSADEWDECTEWAKDGWCEKNKEFMISKGGARDSKGPACPVSCDVPCN